MATVEHCEAKVRNGRYERLCAFAAIENLEGVNLCRRHGKAARAHAEKHPGTFPYYMPQPRSKK